MLHAYRNHLRQVAASAEVKLGEINSTFHTNEAGAATLVTRNYDDNNITKMNTPEIRTQYFL